LIIPIGEWVTKTACQQLRAWQSKGYAPLRVAVNLASSQFAQSDLNQRIISIVNEAGLNPYQLELELTENSLVQNVAEAVATMNQFKAEGIRISIDDFGTGYSSLDYLKQFPFDTLKIDQRFVRNIETRTDNAIITRAIIQMAHNLGLKVIAEGVETNAELEILYQYDCDEIQGYLFSRPIPAAQFEALLKNDTRLEPKFRTLELVTEGTFKNSHGD
jgi:diguanylate cyclase